MPDAGRVFCVAFPFVATLAALVVLLVATLGGKNVHSVYLFQVNLTSLSVSPIGLASLVNGLTGSANTAVDDIVDNVLSSSPNVTAGDLGLQNIYQVNLWGTCSGASADDTSCTDPKWDWASSMLNTTWLESVGSATGANISLPTEVEDGIKTFNTSIKWLQIVFVAALSLLGLELFFGLFSSCSRLWSCLAYIVAGIATTLTIAAAIFATIVAVTVVGVVKSSAAIYGADASFNRTFLTLVWTAVALALVASLFWCFSACCCANRRKDPYHHNHRGSSRSAPFGEKNYGAGSYAPLDGGVPSATYAQQQGVDRGSVYGQQPQQQPSPNVYEPYSHRV